MWPQHQSVGGKGPLAGPAPASHLEVVPSPCREDANGEDQALGGLERSHPWALAAADTPVGSRMLTRGWVTSPGPQGYLRAQEPVALPKGFLSFSSTSGSLKKERTGASPDLVEGQ